jgi:predicted ArsR family transcriptional regulator
LAESEELERKAAQQLDINESVVVKHLDNLKDKGVLERIGGTRGTGQKNRSGG